MKDEERDALYQQLRAGGAERQRQFVAEFLAAGRDARTLEIQFSEAESAPPEPSLAAAAKAAQAVVLGTVADVTYDVNDEGAVWSHATIMVEQSVKGSGLSSSLVVNQLGGPHLDFRLDDGHEHEYLLMSEGSPLLLKGDRALLLLVNLGDGRWYLQKFTGQYRVLTGDRVDVPDMGNPFASAIDGKSLSEVLAIVAAATR